jgi:hypothetical protein
MSRPEDNETTQGIGTRKKWTSELVKRLCAAAQEPDLQIFGTDGSPEPDWYKIKAKYFAEYAFNPSQLRWKWGRLRHVDFNLSMSESQRQQQDQDNCHLCQQHRRLLESLSPHESAQPEQKRKRGKYDRDSCGWCVNKHRACLPNCIGRAHLPRDTPIPADLQKMHSLNMVIRVFHLGLREQVDFDQLGREAREALAALQSATGKISLLDAP